jgi:hypothetical protein
MRGKTAEAILNATGTGLGSGFGPVADDVVVFSNYENRANQGLLANIVCHDLDQ